VQPHRCSNFDVEECENIIYAQLTMVLEWLLEQKVIE